MRAVRVLVLFLVMASALAANPGPVRLRIFPADGVAPAVAGTAQFEAFRSLVGGFDAPDGQIFTSAMWSSSDPSIASIDNSGTVTISGKAGTVFITARAVPFSVSVPFTVTSATLTGIAISPASASVPLGLRQQFRAVGNYSDSTQHDLTDVVLWDSSTAAAAVNTFGLASTHAKGSALISATLGALSGSANLVVTDPLLEALVVTPSNPALKFPAKLQLTATGVYGDGSKKDLSATVTWSSSDASIASISSSGLVTSQNVGHATLTSLQSGISGSTVITVDAEPLGKVTSVATIDCGPGGVSGTCYSLNVSCPQVADQNVIVKVAPAMGTPKGTVFTIGGGGSNGYFDTGYAYGAYIASSLENAGFTVAMLNFNDPNLGWLTGPGGARHLACRPATTIAWIHDSIHQGGMSAPFCGVGESGGSSAIAYSLSHYGLGPILAMVEEAAGPPFARIDHGCICDQAPIVDPCAPTPISSCYYSVDNDVTGFIDTTYQAPLCSSAAATGDTTNAALFLSDSILSGPDAILAFPKTDVHFLMGTKDLTLAAVEQFEYEQAVTSTKSLQCVVSGHSMPNNLTASQQIVNDLTTYCKLQ